MNMLNKKRKGQEKTSESPDAGPPKKQKHTKNGGGQKAETGKTKSSGSWNKNEGEHGKSKTNRSNLNTSKKGQNKGKPISNNRKKQLSGIVTEAKANHQLYTDKKMNIKEKHLLMDSTYNLVKDNIPELSRIKGMGKVIASLLTNRKDTQRAAYVLNCFSSKESKVLLMKSNGYKIAVKLIKIGNPKTVSQFVDACLSNVKGVRALMTDFKSARVLCAAYEFGNADSKKKILDKMVLGNMPLSTDSSSTLSDIFSKCKKDIVEGCKTYIQSVVQNEKYLKEDIVQDVLAICFQTHQATGMDIAELVNVASSHILTFCRRATNCTLALWVVWLATAQTRKQIMKSIKGKVVSILQTYNGRMFMMALLESTDDTKALEKFVLKEFIDSLEGSVLNVEIRKLLEFLLCPRSTKFLHPRDIQLLGLGDGIRTSKKSNEARFEEIKKTLEKPVFSALKHNCESWLNDNKLCLLIIAIVERFGATLDSALLQKLSNTLHSSEFEERISDKAVRMVLESLLTADISRNEANPDADLFINYFVPDLTNVHINNLVSKCPRLIFRLVETASKLGPALTFKLKKSWLSNDAAQKALKEWKHQEVTPQVTPAKQKRKQKK